MCPLSSLYIYMYVYIYNDEREREAFIWHSNGCETAWLILCSRFCKIISPKAKSAASGFPSRQQLTFTVLFCRHMLLLNHEGCKLPFWICFPNYEMNIFIFRKIRINLNTLQFPGAIIWTKILNPLDFQTILKNIYIYPNSSAYQKVYEHLLQNTGPSASKQNSSQMSWEQTKVFESNKTKCEILLESVFS